MTVQLLYIQINSSYSLQLSRINGPEIEDHECLNGGLYLEWFAMMSFYTSILYITISKMYIENIS